MIQKTGPEEGELIVLLDVDRSLSPQLTHFRDHYVHTTYGFGQWVVRQGHAPSEVDKNYSSPSLLLILLVRNKGNQ